MESDADRLCPARNRVVGVAGPYDSLVRINLCGESV